MLLNHVDKLESTYHRLPVSLQNVALSGLGYHIKFKRYNGAFFQALHRMQERDEWSADRLQSYIDDAVKSFVHHAATTVPYYRALFRREGIAPADISSAADLLRLPILRKQQVQDRVEDFISDAIPKSQLIRVETSGSTGAGLPVFVTMQALRLQWAVWWRHRLRHGIQFGTPCVVFRGMSLFPPGQDAPPYSRYNHAERQVYVNGNQIHPASMPHILDDFNRRRVPWFHGYPSVITALASLMLEHDVRLDYPLRWVSLGSEQVLDHQIEAIEKAFGVTPIHHYGMVEAIGNISQDPDGMSYVDEDFGALELAPDEQSGLCTVAGTNLTNPAFPLIRYQVDDLVQFDGERDSRGRRIVDRIHGRADDYVVSSNGARIGRLDFLFMGNANVREAQIIQHELGEIVIRIVRGGSYSDADELRILAAARRRLGSEVGIRFEYVSAIQRGPSGKMRHVLSHLPEGRI
jgi:phenylacetate-CoA ligase